MFGTFVANSFFNLVAESPVNSSPLFPESNILARCPTAHHSRFSRWGHHVHDRSAVRDGVGQ